MTESDLGLGSANRRQHEHRMDRWSREWVESGDWQIQELEDMPADAIGDSVVEPPSQSQRDARK